MDLNRTDGLLENFDHLTLELDDDQVAHVIGNRISDSKAFWNKEYKLDSVRVENNKYWLSDLKPAGLHNYQVEYLDPVVSVSVETLVPMVTANPPQPIVTPYKDDEYGRELAQNLQDALLGKYEDLQLKKKFQGVARHLLMGKRCAILKLRIDKDIGRLLDDGTRFGDIVVDLVQPENVVFEARATDSGDIPLIAELKTATLDEIGQEFPDKKKEIMEIFGYQNGVDTKMNARVDYYETHFSYYNSKGKQEAIAWKYESLILDKTKSPFWNYEETEVNDEGQSIPTNFLSSPKKPYVVFNHINSGRYVIDDISLMDWARNQQDIVNKRGRQIVENADQANSGLIYNTTMIKRKDVECLTGDPGEKMGVAGDVRMAAARLAPNQLPNYVLQDKQDARDRINDIFGTNAPIRGGDSNSPTLGQEILSQRADLSRTQVMATSLEDGADKLYKFMVQMFKVFYDDESTVAFTGSEGQTTFIPISPKTIPAGTSVRVRSGSVLPDDPIAKAQEAMKMAAVYDPLTLVERMGIQNPKEVATRIIKFRMMPDRYMQDVLQESIDGQQADPSAMQEIELLNQGEPVPPQPTPTKEHLATHQQYIEQNEAKLDPQILTLHVEHLRAEAENSKTQLGQGSSDEVSSPGGENQEEAPATPLTETANQPLSEPAPTEPGLLQRLFGGGR